MNLAGEVAILRGSAEGFCHVLTDVVRRQRALAKFFITELVGMAVKCARPQSAV